MGIQRKVWLFLHRKLVESRANSIQDPFKRLRYLRAHVHEGLFPEPEPAKVWTRLVPKPSLGIGLIVALGIVLASSYSVSRVQTTPVIQPLMVHPVLPSPLQPRVKSQTATGVWLVDQKNGVETYSNGLRIDNRFAVANVPRMPYAVYPRDQADIRHVQYQNQPAGIVYHTTESILAPFEKDQNKTLQQISVAVLNFVQQGHSYHFLIDRFGRVFRVVKESDIAFHAGNSAWADEAKVYVNLNSSFLGVAFETQTQAGEGRPTATPAQVDAARVLTEMLRDRYRIGSRSCVTHAQVSLNPLNMLIGYHTDWADKFPFLELGLQDNYSDAPAALFAFGFDYDPSFVSSTGARLMPGLLRAELEIRGRAAKFNVPLSQYRVALRNNYREIAAAAKSSEPAKETPNEEQ